MNPLYAKTAVLLISASALLSCTQQQLNEFNRSLDRLNAQANAANASNTPTRDLARLLVGTWNAEHSRHDTTYTFFPNGSYSTTDTLTWAGRERTTRGRGRWKLVGNRLSLNGQSADAIRFPNANTLYWMDGMGSSGTTTYQRIR